MIARIAVALIAVVSCFYMPSLVDSQYTELGSLRENSILSAALIVIVLAFVRGWTGILICIIETVLIACNFYIAHNWETRGDLYIAAHYTLLHQAAFALELAIISVRIITGLRQIGADIDRFYNCYSAYFGSSGGHERNP